MCRDTCTSTRKNRLPSSHTCYNRFVTSPSLPFISLFLIPFFSSPMNYITAVKIRSHLLLLFLLLSPLALSSVRGDDVKKEDNKQQDPSLVERAIGMTGLNSRWDAIRTWTKLAWMNLRPPDLKFGHGSDANVVKEAATRSFETSKQTVEQAAASAAKVAGEAVEKTTEKLKRSLSSEREPNVEL